MHFKNILSMATAVAVGSTQVTAAIQHGDVAEDGLGRTVKYHQLAKNMWSGVPIEEWDDEIHKRSDVDHGLDKYEVLDTRSMSNGDRTPELDTRNFESFCQSVAMCFTETDGVLKLVGCTGILVEALGTAAGVGNSIWDIITDRSFIITVSGGSIATIAGIRGEKTLWPPPAAECSTQDTEKDAFASAIQAALAVHPGATSITTDVTGPEFAYTVTINVHQEEKPPEPVLGKCFQS